MNLLQKLNLPAFPLFLAPMEDVTTWAFRQVCKKHGVDVVVTEFVSSEGLIRDALKSTRKMKFDDNERPVGIQIFGHDVNSMQEAAIIAAERKPDFIDINCGCPVRKVVTKGAGAALLLNVPKMIDIVKAVVNSIKIPVTVKTRIGWDEKNINIVNVSEQLQDVGAQLLTIHGRTRSQLYTGKADWNYIKLAKDNKRLSIPIIGNGDIHNIQDALDARDYYNVDGIMIGRAAIGNPWIFSEIKNGLNSNTLPNIIDIKQRIETIKLHFGMLQIEKGERVAILEMRKHYSNYFKGINDFKTTKMQLLMCSELHEVENIFENILQKYYHVLP